MNDCPVSYSRTRDTEGRTLHSPAPSDIPRALVTFRYSQRLRIADEDTKAETHTVAARKERQYDTKQNDGGPLEDDQALDRKCRILHTDTDWVTNGHMRDGCTAGFIHETVGGASDCSRTDIQAATANSIRLPPASAVEDSAEMGPAEGHRVCMGAL